MNISEDQLARWAKAPSETEETKCQHTVSRIKTAITNKFGSAVDMFLQGSYKNRTNVKLDSDVDIVVRHNHYFFPDTYFLTPADKMAYEQSFVSSDYSFAQFKNDVEYALQQEFGHQPVTRKNKCIMVDKNDYRVNADVVPCFVHRRMATATTVSAEGIELRSDKGERIYSFPEQHFDNGVDKNAETKQVYKSIVRILKNVRNNLIDDYTITLDDMPSFFLECLVWNVPSDLFNQNNYSEITKSIIKKVWNDMRNINKSKEYAEVCNLKWLFRGGQKDPAKAEDYMLKAWQYIGY